MFQVDRAIFTNSIWNNVAEFRVFFYILGNAVWSEDGVKYGDIVIGRGQFLRSYRNIREDLMYMDNNTVKYYGIATIKRIVDKLVLDGRLQKEETELGTLFTVVNYSNYQGFERYSKDNLEQQRNSNGTATEQQRNNNKKDKKDNKDNYIYIVEYLNSKANKNYKHTSKATQRHIDARLNENYTIEDFKNVIDIKVSHWLGDPKMEMYLRPETLFGNKFEGYLNEKIRTGSINTQQGPSKKTRFHNFEQRSDKYSAKDLDSKVEDIARRKREEYLAKLREQKEGLDGN